MLCLFGCGKTEQKLENASKNTNAVFQATIAEIGDGELIVVPNEGYTEAAYAKRIRVVIQNMVGSPEPVVGDVVEITYNGIMTEEDPPSPCGVAIIEIVEHGE